MADIGNLTLTTINGIGQNAANWAIGYGTNQFMDRFFGRKDTLKFYYDYESGGKMWQVLVKGVAGGAVGTLTTMAKNAFNGVLNGHKTKESEPSLYSKRWNRRIELANNQDNKRFSNGRMVLEEGTIYALDEWGDVANEALMLAIKTDTDIHVYQRLIASTEKESAENKFTTKTLVWYDTTAIVHISSDKNIITTRVQGRDYSRKELVSNGDIKFSVSGQISSGMPDVYPTAEVEKFFKVMQHKGIVQVNCQALNVLGVEQILITDFNISSKEGYKSIQNYSFSGLGLQPANEIEIKDDLIIILSQDTVKKEEEEKNPWISLVENQAKAVAEDIFNRGVNIATGMLNDLL